MKKPNVLISMLILTVLCLSVSTATMAAEPDYVGVAEDDEITLTGNIDVGALLTVLGLNDQDLDDLGLEQAELGGFTIKIAVDWVSDDSGGAATVNITLEITDAAGDDASSDLKSTLSMYLASLTESIGIVSETYYTNSLITATDIDWEKAAESLESTYGSGWTVNAEGNGYRAKGTMDDSDNEEHDIELAKTYSDNGVIATAEYKVDGIMIFSIGIGIPGYELTILLGVTAAGAIGLIYTVMKRKK